MSHIIEIEDNIENEKYIKYSNVVIGLDVEVETKKEFFHLRIIEEVYGYKFDQIIVSQYIEDSNYVVTYCEEHKLFLGWSVDIEQNGGPQKFDVGFELYLPDLYNEKYGNYKIYKFALYQKRLLICHGNGININVDLIDFNNKKFLEPINKNKNNKKFLRLKDVEKIFHKKILIEFGFLPDGDIILIDDESIDYKIYKYSGPTRNVKEIFNIRNSKSLKEYFIYQTKLFLFNEFGFIQWDLSKMSVDMEYIYLFDYDIIRHDPFNLVINKNQTLLALNINPKIDIFSMETGVWISSCDFDSGIPIEFVTLGDGSEGLIIRTFSDSKITYKFLDPFQSFDAIDVTNDISGELQNIITKSNKKICMIEYKVGIADGLDVNTAHHNGIYASSTFKNVQEMLMRVNIKRKNKHVIEFTEGHTLKLGKEPFQFILEGSIYEKNHYEDNISIVKLFAFQNYNKYKRTQNNDSLIYFEQTNLLSYQLLNNRDLVLITKHGIFIYTVYEDLIRLRYFWMKNIMNDDTIQELLNKEFISTHNSLPLPNLEDILKFSKDIYDQLVLSIINEPEEFSKFGPKILQIAIDHKQDPIIQLIFEKIYELIKNNPANYGYLTFISLHLPNLCDRYSYLVTKYILLRSIPICLSVKNSTNNFLYAYSNNTSIEKSNPSNNNFIFFRKYLAKTQNFIKNNNYFNSFHTNLTKHSKIQEVISFVNPFPQFCKYQDKNYNSWNEILTKSKSILFCNIDSNNFYKWWNFAAIIEFKWNIFKNTYYLIWFFYTIFFLCFALASTLIPNNILFIISIVFGFGYLTVEGRQCYWKPKFYFIDIWNLFDVGAYSLPIITSLYWIINGKPPLWLIAFTNLLLYFKFLLFFRVFKSFGIYFVLIIGVAKKVFPFLMILFFIILGFAHAFFIILNPKEDEKNDPQNLVTKYDSINSDGTMTSTLIQQPDSNTNMFSWYPTSLLAMYLLLTGDSGSLSSWTYREAPAMTIFLVLFTFFTAIYLMNLFIGLLNMAIEDLDKYEEFLLQKAMVIMEIELFYMLPYHRKNKEYFPDWIYYDVPANEVRRLINAIDNNQTEFDAPSPIISEKLRNLLKIPEPVNENKSINELKQQLTDEFKKQTKDIQESLLKTIKIPEPANENKLVDELKQQMEVIQELLLKAVKTQNDKIEEVNTNQ
ncbi:unnamed protein product [Rhizophagus irregularis]|uniref:Ion transport domain-containing protein n=1 Tax=Rhizophagus irregularis TaxID=588596 RepID=A0A2I1H795_9GLOM|nr:hypothetical protein RhiirA4_473731 [Rhizophagus irregularis]CAB4436873.1 unnamed protein product [Rhizophagus irregularis]